MRLDPGAFAETVRAGGEILVRKNAVARMWARDGALWSADAAEAALCADRLGWLDLHDTMRPHLPRLVAFATTARDDGITDVVLCGMGGSSLAPEVLARVLGGAGVRGAGGTRLHVLDTTDPREVGRVTSSLDLGHTLVVVASKSGGTIETDALRRHFQGELAECGVSTPAAHMVAITDPGSALHALAEGEGWREVFLNPPDVGGRYSALSLFGLVPAALLGVDLVALLDGAAACAAEPAEAVRLGAGLGALAASGRDKLTIVADDALASIGDWVEQLVAESTGKLGPEGPRGIVPVVREPADAPRGDDRMYVALVAAGGSAPQSPDGAPVWTFEVGGARHLGALFWAFEAATALASVVLGVEPFDQRDVASAKAATNAVLAGDAGPVPDPAAAGELVAAADAAPQAGYVAILSYLPRGADADAAVADLAAALGRRSGRPVTVGVGPRYLHSTGQLHKGGPNVGVFVVLEGPDPTGTDDDLAVPGRDYSFGRLFTAQHAGDLATLAARGRALVRLRAGEDVAADVRAWTAALSADAG